MRNDDVEGQGLPAARDAAPSAATPASVPIPRSALPAPRSVLPNGIVLLGSERPESQSVVVRARLRAGALYDREETEGLARLTATMLQRGTERYRFAELNELTDALGASITVEAGRLAVDLTVRCLVEDFARMTGILADVMRRPAFPADELEKVRGQTIAAIMQGEQDTRTVAERGLRRLAYPAGHPYARSVLGTEDSVRSLDRAALVDYHARYYRPDVLSMSIVGGVPFDTAVETVAREFGDWRVEGAPPPFEVPAAEPPAELVRGAWGLPGKTQSDIALGLPALSRTDPDYYALDLAKLILGRLGLYGRLGKSVREE